MVMYDIFLKMRCNKFFVNISSIVVLICIGFIVLVEWKIVKEEDFISFYFILNFGKVFFS